MATAAATAVTAIKMILFCEHEKAILNIVIDILDEFFFFRMLGSARGAHFSLLIKSERRVAAFAVPLNL